MMGRLGQRFPAVAACVLFIVGTVVFLIQSPVGLTGAAAASAEQVDERAPDAQCVLRLAEDARWVRPIRYREVRTLFRRTAVQTTIRTVSWQPPALLRLEEEHDEGRRVLLARPDAQWLYDSRYPYVLRTTSGDIPSLRRFLGSVNPLEQVSPASGGEVGLETAVRRWSLAEDRGPGDRSVYVVERLGDVGRSRYWIDREHYFPWKEEHYGPDLKLAAVIVRLDVELEPLFAEDEFQFEPPIGTELVTDLDDWRIGTVTHDIRRQAPFPPAMFFHIPPGYALIEGGVDTFDGKPGIHWRFYDGSSLLSVIQLKALAGRRPSGAFPEDERPQFEVVGDMLVGRAVHSGYLFVVVGQVSPDEARLTLAGLQFADE